ncbi:MAG: Asp-tRNA(Asn)/Glu-tRNA(Gln) amidotransferase subunit GatC [Candidatus Paceibacterota bacterium]
MDKENVFKLADLAHIEISDTEAEKLVRDLSSIVEYVSHLQEVSGVEALEKKVGAFHNIMREDENPHDSGIYTEKLLNEAPEREGDYIKVKKIL